MAEESFFADVKQEGASIDLEKETPLESQPETTTAEESQIPQNEEPENQAPNAEKSEQLPWAKDPRWKAWKKEQSELRKTVDELLPLKEEFQQFKSRSVTPPSGGAEQLPAWFIQKYGDNPELWQEISSDIQQRTVSLKQDVLNEIKAEEQRKVQDQQKWSQWVENQIDELVEEGKQFDRNELMKVMEEFRPTNEQNFFDFRKGLAILEYKKKNEVDPEKAKARKDIAAFTTTPSKSEPKQKDYYTPQDLRRK